MKFKTREHLHKNIHSKKFPENTLSYDLGIDNAFDSFKERLEFYKRYEDKWDLLMKEESLIYDMWREIVLSVEIHVMPKYNDWLFNYCFGDILK